MGAMLIFALAIATIVPLVFLYFLYAQDFYGTGSFGIVLLCFAWGMIAFGLAYGVYEVAVAHDLFPWLSIPTSTWILFVAPITEEILKASILIYLVRRPNFTYFVDGAIYGFAAGIGFAVIENWSYVLGDPNAGLGLAIGRVMSTNLVHGTGTALVGIALGYSRFQRFRGGLLLLLAGWLIGMTVHIGFNNLVNLYNNQIGPLLLYAALVGFGGVGVIVWMMYRGLAEQKKWIEETLGDADRVTGSEAKVVGKLGDIETLLEPIAKQFGAEKAKECEHFLFLQARIGIKRKTLEKLTDEKLKAAVQAEVDEMSIEMNESRRKVGAYCMLYIRNIFPEDASPLWGRLENAIQERIAARPATAGPSLWSTLGDRAAKAAASPHGPENESS
jgi:RsiW-degrading membrane proteinase PrsW (M82 family)